MFISRLIKSRAVLGLSFVCLSAVFTNVQAAPSAAQIEMFKNLPASQQQELMKQYNVSPDALTNRQPAEPVTQDTTAETVIKQREISQDIESSEQSKQAQKSVKQADLEEKQVTTAVKQKIEPFGYDLFAGSPSTFAPLANAPVPSDYIVGPGDSLNVQIYGSENQSYALQVDREGRIQLPNVGPLQIAGLNFSKASELIQKEIKRAVIGVDVSVTAGALRSIRVFVLGDVFQPGAYVVSGLSTMSNALLSSGGIKTIGSLRNIQLKRNGKVVSNLDLYDFLLKGDMSKDVSLLDGDVIFVPTLKKTVTVAGEVKRPAVYELKNEKTIGEVIKLAGGFSQSASPAHSKLERMREDGYREVKDINLLATQALAKKVKTGDALKVVKVVDEYKDIVLVKGSVSRPGEYQWQPGLRIADLFTGQNMDEFLARTDLEHVFIKRELGAERNIEILMTNLKLALQNPQHSDNIRLNARDEILVLNYDDNRVAKLAPWVKIMQRQAKKDQLPKVVKVSGNVNYPGTYPLAIGMSIEEVFSVAGGASLSAESRAFLVAENEKNRDIKVKMIDLTGDLHAVQALAMNELIVLDEKVNPSLQSRVNRLVDRLQMQVKRDELPQVVKISGSVNHPGTYPLTEGMTLNDLFDIAGGGTITTLPQALLKHESALNKKISVEQVDLSSDLKNYRLQPRDELIVLDELNKESFDARIQALNQRLKFQATAEQPSQLVSIEGFVRFPGIYPLTKGMTAQDLINLAGGLVESAYEVDGEIVSRLIDQDSRKLSVSSQTLKLSSELFTNYSLQTMDSLVIKRKPEWSERKTVKLTGEVTFPGTYVLKENETLAQLIERAGGFTDDAFIEGTFLQRAKLVEQQARELEKMRSQLEASLAQNATGLESTNPEAAMYLSNVLKEANAAKATGRVSLVNHAGNILSSMQNMNLKDGDSVNVPDSPQTVSVIGEVFASQTFSYDPNLNAQDYLQMAGGANSLADIERAYIVRASGQVQPIEHSGFFYAMNDQQVNQGDVIVVPMDPDQFRELKEWKEISTIASQIVLAIASIKTIGVF